MPLYQRRAMPVKQSQLKGALDKEFQNIQRAIGTYPPIVPGETGVVNQLYPIGDIRRYGAIAGGSNDCTTAITNAVISVNGLGGGFVTVPSASGSYWRITGTVPLLDNVWVSGCGLSGAIRQTTPETRTFSGASLSNIRLINLGLFGEGGYSNAWVNDSHFDRGIDLDASTNVVIAGCIFLNYALAAIWLNDVTLFQIHNNVILGTNTFGAAINAGSGHQFAIVSIGSASLDGIISENDVSETAFGINCGDGSDIVITGNDVHDIPGQHGMYIGTNRTVVDANTVRDCALIGIKVFSGVADQEDVSVVGNVITSNVTGAQPGIVASGDASFVLLGCTISGNTIRNTSATPTTTGMTRGIDVSACRRLLVSGNVITDPLQHGIILNNTDDLFDVAVVDNIIEAPQQYGILANGTVTRATIAGNRIANGTSAGYGISITSGDDIVVRGNDVRGAFDYSCSHTTATKVVVVENTFAGYTTAPMNTTTELQAYRDNQDGREVTSHATAATLKPFDLVVLLDGSGGAFNMTLRDATKMKGQRFSLMKSDAGGNAVGFAGAGGQTVNGAGSKTTATQYTRIEVVSDGSNWVTA